MIPMGGLALKSLRLEDEQNPTAWRYLTSLMLFLAKWSEVDRSMQRPLILAFLRLALCVKLWRWRLSSWVGLRLRSEQKGGLA